MSQQQLKEINKLLSQGILPDCLNFQLHQNDQIDWEKVRYNSFYKSFEFAESKFPPGHENIPGFDKVIESCIPTQTPLEEMNDRIESKANIPSDK
jgi:hypothetical protein